MEWLRMVVAVLLTAAVTGLISFNKSSRDTDVKVALLDNRIYNNETSLRELKAQTSESIADIAADMKLAAKELLTAASNVQSMAQSQGVVNSVSSKILDSLTAKVESQAASIAELRGLIYGMNNQTNHRG